MIYRDVCGILGGEEREMGVFIDHQPVVAQPFASLIRRLIPKMMVDWAGSGE